MCLPVIQCRITLQRSLLNIRLYCPLLCTSLPHCTILCPPYIYDRKVFIITVHLTLSINVKTFCYGVTDIVCILHLYFGFPTLLFHDCVNSHLVVYHGKMANAHVSPLMWLHGHVPAMCKDVLMLFEAFAPAVLVGAETAGMVSDLLFPPVCC